MSIMLVFTLWGVHSVVTFSRAFLTFSTGYWADNALTVHLNCKAELPKENQTKHPDRVDARQCTPLHTQSVLRNL